MHARNLQVMTLDVVLERSDRGRGRIVSSAGGSSGSLPAIQTKSRVFRELRTAICAKGHKCLERGRASLGQGASPMLSETSLSRREQKLKRFAHSAAPRLLIMRGALVAAEGEIVPKLPALSDQSVPQRHNVVEACLWILAFACPDIQPDLLIRFSAHAMNILKNGPVRPPDRWRHHNQFAENPQVPETQIER